MSGAACRSIYVTSSLGQDTTELQLLSTGPAAAPAPADADARGSNSSTSSLAVLQHLASSDKCDVGQVVVAWLERVPLAVGFTYLRQEWKVRQRALSGKTWTTQKGL